MAIKVVLAFSAVVAVCLAVQVKPPNSLYTVDYSLKNNTGNDEKIIDFEVTATNVTGWVGVGINENAATMVGAHVFVAGVTNATTAYAREAYSVRNTLPDWKTPPGNWTVVSSAREANNITSYTARINLNKTGIAVQNKNVFLIWSYHETSDDINSRHTTRGNCTVNLVTEKVNCTAGPNGGTGGGDNSGADALGFATGGLLATVLVLLAKF